MSDTPPDAVVPDFGPGALDRAIELVHFLRKHCPWDAKQTPHTLIPHLLEEAHEVVDAIRSGDSPALEGELGDLLLNLAFQIAIAEEGTRMDRHSVAQHLQDKMVRRHPHLFGLGEKQDWETLKAREREQSSPSQPAADPDGTSAADPDGTSAADPDGTSALDGLAKGMDPLLTAHRLQDRASGVGFDWNDVSGAWDKAAEELEEVKEALAGGDAEHITEELGDLLFAVVNVVRLAGHHSDPILDQANRKFAGRFKAVESLARQRGLVLGEASLDELDILWEAVKARQ
jgi:nucleoside triphosphate diphosphatase